VISNSPAKKVLVIDDSQALADCYHELLSQVGFDVVCFNSCSLAIENLPKHLPLDLILVDYSLPQMNGIQFIQEFKKRYPESFEKTRIVVFSCHSDSSPVSKLVRETGAFFLEKDADISEFVDSVQRLTA
jgi:DNA-binding NtrC family response regulator